MYAYRSVARAYRPGLLLRDSVINGVHYKGVLLYHVVIVLTHKLTVILSLFQDQSVKLFPAPTFCYAFFLFRCVLSQGGAAVKGNLAVCNQVLKLILEHAKMRRSSENPTVVDVVRGE